MGLLKKLFGGGGSGDRGDDATRPVPAPAPEAKRETCPSCDRVLLPMTPCPFCNSQHFGEDVKEATVSTAYTPKTAVAGLGGVIVADQAAQKHGAKGFIHVYEGPNKGASVLLGAKFVTIGRNAQENILALKDSGVSTKHCEIRPIHHGYQIVDVGSKNGTFVNDQRVKERILANGDIVGFGATRISVSIC